MGDFAGNLIEGKNIGQAALGGVEAGALDYVGGNIGGDVSKGLQGTAVGNELSDIGSDISNSAIGQDVSGLVGDVKGGVGSLESSLGISSAAAGPTTAGLIAHTGAATADPALASTVGGTILGNGVNSAANALGVGGSGGTVVGNAINSAGGAVLGTGAGAAGSAAGSGTGSSNAGLLSDLGISRSDILPTAIAGYGLLKDTSQGSIPGEAQLQQQAQQLGAQGKAFQTYLTSGQLPPGLQSQITEATQSAQAAVRSQYAAMGLSGSSMEAQALNQVAQNSTAQTAQIAEQLYNAGVNETGLSSQIYQTLLNFNQQQNQDTGNAISSLAVALAGGGSPAARQSTGASA